MMFLGLPLYGLMAEEARLHGSCVLYLESVHHGHFGVVAWGIDELPEHFLSDAVGEVLSQSAHVR